jgi:hypothetical protein
VTEKLLNAGFVKVEEDEVMCIPPSDCQYFWKDRFVIPIAER